MLNDRASDQRGLGVAVFRLHDITVFADRKSVECVPDGASADEVRSRGQLGTSGSPVVGRWCLVCPDAAKTGATAIDLVEPAYRLGRPVAAHVVDDDELDWGSRIDIIAEAQVNGEIGNRPGNADPCVRLYERHAEALADPVNRQLRRRNRCCCEQDEHGENEGLCSPLEPERPGEWCQRFPGNFSRCLTENPVCHDRCASFQNVPGYGAS